VAEKVVFDTNIRLAAVLWRGAAYKCWLAARVGLVELVYCRKMITEFSEQLSVKFGFSVDQVRAAVHEFRRFGQAVATTGTLHVVDSNPDPMMISSSNAPWSLVRRSLCLAIATCLNCQDISTFGSSRRACFSRGYATRRHWKKRGRTSRPLFGSPQALP
jgi:hypothetical protein